MFKAMQRLALTRWALKSIFYLRSQSSVMVPNIKIYALCSLRLLTYPESCLLLVTCIGWKNWRENFFCSVALKSIEWLSDDRQIVHLGLDYLSQISILISHFLDTDDPLDEHGAKNVGRENILIKGLMQTILVYHLVQNVSNCKHLDPQHFSSHHFQNWCYWHIRNNISTCILFIFFILLSICIKTIKAVSNKVKQHWHG